MTGYLYQKSLGTADNQHFIDFDDSAARSAYLATLTRVAISSVSPIIKNTDYIFPYSILTMEQYTYITYDNADGQGTQFAFIRNLRFNSPDSCIGYIQYDYFQNYLGTGSLQTANLQDCYIERQHVDRFTVMSTKIVPKWNYNKDFNYVPNLKSFVAKLYDTALSNASEKLYLCMYFKPGNGIAINLPFSVPGHTYTMDLPAGISPPGLGYSCAYFAVDLNNITSTSSLIGGWSVAGFGLIYGSFDYNGNDYLHPYLFNTNVYAMYLTPYLPDGATPWDYGYIYDNGMNIITMSGYTADPNITSEFTTNNFSVPTLVYNKTDMTTTAARSQTLEPKMYCSPCFETVIETDTGEMTIYTEGFSNTNTTSSNKQLKVKTAAAINGVKTVGHLNATNYDFDLNAKEYINTSGSNTLGLMSNAYQDYLALNANSANTGLIISGALTAVAAIATAATGGAAAPTLGLVGAGSSLIQSGATELLKREDMKKQPNTAKAVTGDAISSILNETGAGVFRVFRKQLPNQLKTAIFDFYTKYGYLTDTVETPSLRSRYWYNYIKTLQPNVTINEHDDRAELYNILNAGCTIWHCRNNTVKTIGDYSKENAEVALL